MDYREFKNIYFKEYASVTEDEISGEPEDFCKNEEKKYWNWARTIASVKTVDSCFIFP